MRSPQRAEDPGTVCTRYPRSCDLFSLPTPENASHSPTFPSVAVRRGQPPGHARLPLRILCPSGPFALPPLGIPYPSILVSLAAFAHCPLGIPCLPGLLHTLRGEFRAPRGLKHTPLKSPDPRHTLGPSLHPGRCSRGLSDCLATMFSADSSLSPRDTSSVELSYEFFGHKPHSEYQQGGRDSVFPCPAQCPVSSFQAHTERL